jgi:hypothetical protein
MWPSEAAVEALATFLKMGNGAFLDIREATRDPNVKPMISRLRLKKSALGGKAEMSATG